MLIVLLSVLNKLSPSLSVIYIEGMLKSPSSIMGKGIRPPARANFLFVAEIIAFISLFSSR
jgi:hypothetical protein